MGNQFLLSVADAILIDKDSDSVVLKSKTLMTSALKQAIEQTLIKGGFGNKIQMVFNHDKVLEISLEDCVWDEAYLAINSNQLISTGADNFYIVDEIVTLSSGSGTVLGGTPVGNLYITKADGSYITITPTGSNFTVPGGAATTVKATYKYSTTVNKITITSDTFPKAYRLILKAKLFQQETGQSQTGELEIIVESFQPNGSYEINFGSSATSTSKLEGKALEAINSVGQGYYAIARIKNIISSAIAISNIVCSPNTMTLSTGTPTGTVNIIGLRSGGYGNITNPTGTTFVSGTPATATVNATTGVVTKVAASGTTVITATNGSYTDTCLVTIS